MAKLPFHEWAPGEINRLRSEANALERALALYTGVGRSSPSTRLIPPIDDARRGPRTSKYEPLFHAFESEARPLTFDEMLEIAAKIGVKIDRNNMRSQVFTQKQSGRVIPEGRGYRWQLQKLEAASPEKEDAA